MTALYVIIYLIIGSIISIIWERVAKDKIETRDMVLVLFWPTVMVVIIPYLLFKGLKLGINIILDKLKL